MDDIQSVTITFDGICTHYRGVVPGVPHRVVLPDATDALSGWIKVGDEPAVLYDIQSHTARLTVAPTVVPITMTGYIEGGVLLAGVRLQIANAIDQDLDYGDDGNFDKIPSLSNFMTAYQPSSDVVHGGRAICYFDFFGGMVQTTVAESGAINTSITVQTNGVPMLQVTPMRGHPLKQRPPKAQFSLPAQLDIINLCAFGGRFDFLLNYLTAEGGIPTEVSDNFPLEPVVLPDVGTTAACSDSRYP